LGSSTAKITVEMGSAAKAKRAYQALLPETRSRVTGRSNVELKVKGSTLTLNLKASDLSALRASVNSYCRWASMLRQLLSSIESL